MADNSYKLILSGKIAEGYDVEIVHEKLALIFDIALKKIPKLLKKQTIIRKNLTLDVAFKYKSGLEKIGLLCEINPNPVQENPPHAESFTVNDKDDAINDKDNAIIDNTGIEGEIEQFSFEPEQTLTLDRNTLRVINIKIPLGSMVILMIKWILASIPALIILGGIGYMIQTVDWHDIIVQVGELIPF
ncbi:MAG: hypothetical protein KAI83_09685 [Thiomargarita sp.]|nr:hypothetical protein [Thiomargarita sp.]